MEEKKLPSREQFILNVDDELYVKLKSNAEYKGIPLNTYVNILLNEIISEVE